MSTTAEHALAYAARGWRVVPIGPGTKYPALERWQERATTDVATIVAHWTAHPDHGVGIATGEASGVFVLDVDPAAGGGEAFLDLEARNGPLPGTVEVITGSGGRHLYYRHPPGLDLNNSAGRLGPGLDIRANGGQVVAPPTLHPDTGQPYAWDVEYHPDDVAIADAPAWLLALLEPPPKVDAGPRGEYEAARLAWDRFNYNPHAAEYVAAWLLESGWTEGRPDRHGARYFTRPGKHEGISASLGKVAPGVLFCFTSSAPPFEAERSYDPADVLALLKFDGDRAAADADLVRQGWGIASHSVPAGTAITAPASPAQAAELDPRWLPEAFWTARPYLTHIRQASRSRLVAADAVLGAVLARVAVILPHTVELPAIVGKPVGLTFYAGLVGPPESGKSTAAGLAVELLPHHDPDRFLDPLAIGSGEGFIDALFDMVAEERDDGKAGKLTKQQTKHGALFHVDEGTILGDLAQRSGTTLMPTLRTAFTHGTLGQANASAERKRMLPGHQYVYGVTIGIQPELAGPLLGEVAAGTPQRFVWLMATDPGISDEPVDWPGPIPWTPPTGALTLMAEVNAGGWGRSTLSVPPEVRAEVRADRLSAMRGEDRDPGDAHRTLVRLKVAALLGLLDGRTGIDLTDWHLAGIVVDTSRAVRRSVEGLVGAVAIQVDKAITAKLERREAYLEGSRERRAIESAARSVANVVRRHVDTTKHEGPCPRRCLSSAVASKHRELVGLDAIIAEAIEREWIVAPGNGYAAGPSMPAQGI